MQIGRNVYDNMQDYVTYLLIGNDIELFINNIFEDRLVNTNRHILDKLNTYAGHTFLMNQILLFVT